MDNLFFFLNRHVGIFTGFNFHFSSKAKHCVNPFLPLGSICISLYLMNNIGFYSILLLVPSLIMLFLMIRLSWYLVNDVNIFISTNAFEFLEKGVRSFKFQKEYVLLFKKTVQIDVYVPEEKEENNTIENYLNIEKIFIYNENIEIEIKNFHEYKYQVKTNDNISMEDLMTLMTYQITIHPSKVFVTLEKFLVLSKNKLNSNSEDNQTNVFYFNNKKQSFNSTIEKLTLRNKNIKIFALVLQDLKNKEIINDDLALEDFMKVLSCCFLKEMQLNTSLKLELNSKELSSFMEYFFVPFLNLIGDRTDFNTKAVYKYFHYKKGQKYKPVVYSSIARNDRRDSSNLKIERYNLLLHKYKRAITANT